MVNVTLVCVGSLKEKYLRDAVAEYQKRLTTLCKFQIIELSEEKLPSDPSEKSINSALEKEGERIIAKIPKGAKIITLVIEGTQKSSEKLAEMIENYCVSSCASIAFVIGSSFGLSKQLKQKSDFKLSMSQMTFPHQLARVMLCEQIYRAFQIINNTKYHK